MGMKTLLIKDVPEDLGKQFKAGCVMRGVTMRDAVLGFMQKSTDENPVGSQATEKREPVTIGAEK